MLAQHLRRLDEAMSVKVGQVVSAAIRSSTTSRYFHMAPEAINEVRVLICRGQPSLQAMTFAPGVSRACRCANARRRDSRQVARISRSATRRRSEIWETCQSPPFRAVAKGCAQGFANQLRPQTHANHRLVCGDALAINDVSAAASNAGTRRGSSPATAGRPEPPADRSPGGGRQVITEIHPNSGGIAAIFNRVPEGAGASKTR